MSTVGLHTCSIQYVETQLLSVIQNTYDNIFLDITASLRFDLRENFRCIFVLTES